MNALRCFVALELPAAVTAALADVQRAVVRRVDAIGIAREVRWVAPEGIHLTLAFLGDVPTPHAEEIREALESALRGQAGFSPALGPAGVFPSPRATRVVWVGVRGDIARLRECHRVVGHALSPLGYPPEQRPFSPHLTLGRVRETATPEQRQALAEAAQLVTPPDLSWRVEEISLMRSELSRAGARYSRLAAMRLA